MAEAKAPNSGSRVALEQFDECTRICEQLSPLGAEFAASNEPLTTLLGTQINTLTTETHLLDTEISHLGLRTNPSYVYDSESKIAKALTSNKIRLFETLELLDFHRSEERYGQDGALNALYATMYILGRLSNRNSFMRNKEAVINTGLLLIDTTSESVAAPIGAESIGLPGRIDATSSAPMYRPRPRPSQRPRPRHIQPYQVFSDTSYILDTANKLFLGSSAIVQKVKHKQSGEPLAMKTFLKVDSDERRRRVLREIGVLEVCLHKNIVRLIEAMSIDEDEDCLRFIMSPWAECTLTNLFRSFDTMRKNRLPWFKPDTPNSDSFIFRIMYELADAVEYLHSLSIKHKDLKPDNILIHNEESDHPTPLVTDVGISKVYIRGAKTNYKDSTYEYLAPEQHHEIESTLKSDVWQLGCCFAGLLVFAIGGTSAYEKLQSSFNRDGEDCSCSIALEYKPFMNVLTNISAKGSNPLYRMALEVVNKMLVLDPSKRVDMKFAKHAFSQLCQ